VLDPLRAVVRSEEIGSQQGPDGREREALRGGREPAGEREVAVVLELDGTRLDRTREVPAQGQNPSNMKFESTRRRKAPAPASVSARPRLGDADEVRIADLPPDQLADECHRRQ
jgi:hypothetical protein